VATDSVSGHCLPVAGNVFDGMVHPQVGACAFDSLTITFDVFPEELETLRCFQQPILSVNSNAVASYAFCLICPAGSTNSNVSRE
jgi:hypothetical protein